MNPLISMIISGLGISPDQIIQLMNEIPTKVQAMVTALDEMRASQKRTEEAVARIEMLLNDFPPLAMTTSHSEKNVAVR
jgi:hypothetical protein